MPSIKKRAKIALNLKTFNNDCNLPELVRKSINLNIPSEEVYILRMLIKKPFEKIKLPVSLGWVYPLIDASVHHQGKMDITQPFIYLTIRSNCRQSRNNDTWHVDGFSTSITHLPEQNYCWANKYPTEFIAKRIKFPKEFNPLKHNIHSYIQKNISSEYEKENLISTSPNSLYCFDPYVIHRRPNNIPEKENRTFIRISFTPIEINDINNSFNPLIPTNYTRDGVKEFRNKLIDF